MPDEWLNPSIRSKFIQVKLTANDMSEIRFTVLLVSLVYVRYWCEVPITQIALLNDTNLIILHSQTPLYQNQSPHVWTSKRSTTEHDSRHV